MGKNHGKVPWERASWTLGLLRGAPRDFSVPQKECRAKWRPDSTAAGVAADEGVGFAQFVDYCDPIAWPRGDRE